MTGKRFFVSEVARRDIAAARDFYRSEAGVAVAGRFLAAIEIALRKIAEFPGHGSARYAQDAGETQLRFVRISGYPYLAFYRDRDDVLEVWRVLHAQRDIPDSLCEP